MSFDFDPTIGRVAGSIVGHPPFVSDPDIGRSRSVAPIITRIDVTDAPKLGTRVGTTVKKIFFADYPAFTFNVCFAVGYFSLILKPGSYGDPYSLWFNVFMGYYQLDAPKSSWTRPFGYESSNTHSAIAFHDIVRLGKADWNYFSNYMYGVPEDCIATYNAIDFGDTPCVNLGRQTIGAHQWDFFEVDKVVAVSSYESGATNARKLVNNSFLSPLWRRTFGLPHPRPDYPQSFIPTILRARIFASFCESEEHYHTTLFGGTINKSFPASMNDLFLELQMSACRQVILEHYSQLGFSIDVEGPMS
jgi:hypothetical protein